MLMENIWNFTTETIKNYEIRSFLKFYFIGHNSLNNYILKDFPLTIEVR